ncbi:hypothetical protein [Streptomyces sp. bgisy034]|uniref:hypothetical protein n=1 Tax=Streptomyces sp. bgisy034 TaxID=3413774 RepID=UPI003EBEDDF1
MSAATVINVGYVAFLLVFAYCMWRACREPRPKARDVIAAAQHDVGPDSLRLMQDLDEHLDAYYARLAHLFEELGPPPGQDPMAAGRKPLKDAIRQDQKRRENS